MISVIIPIYNDDCFLYECLKSIQHQNYQDFEVLMVNDGSTDSSETICQRFVHEDDRFKLYNQVNRGASAARNYALKKASGDYITFIDADDQIPEYFLKDALEKIKFYEADIVIGGYYKTNTGNNYLPALECTKLYRESEINRIKRFFLAFSTDNNNSEFRNCENILSPWGKLFKTDILKNVYFPEDLILDEDTVFNIYALDNARRVVVVPSVYYMWRKNNNSLSGRVYRPHIVKELEESDKYFEKYVYDHKDENFGEELLIRRIRSYVRCINHYFCSKGNPDKNNIKAIRKFMYSQPYQEALTKAEVRKFKLPRNVVMYAFLGKRKMPIITILFHKYRDIKSWIVNQTN